MKPAGLRARVTGGFTVGALLLSASMAVVSYQLIRTSLLDERERASVRAAYFNATVVRSGLSAADPDVAEMLRSLETGGDRRTVVRWDGSWYARTADQGITEAIPAGVQDLVAGGTPAVQRVRVDGHPAVVVAVPLTPSAAFYEIDSLRELDQTFRTLALVLASVAIMVACGGAALGWYATRYVLRPLTSVARAAEDIAAGKVKTRLDPAAEPDLARLTTSFNRMVDELAERLERDRRFAADVSHELRSPLQTLSAAISVLAARREHLDTRTAAAAELITDEVNRFQKLVQDLLELARGDQPAARSGVDVAELARRVCRGRGVDEDIVDTDGATGTVWYVDRRRVEQILANLVENAARYGGGATAIRLSRAPGHHVLEVDDSGPGVSPQDKKAIFHRFVRGRAANARHGDGTGLGLAIVAQHAAAHGGRACVLDRPGGGARFRVELPEDTP
ncbi:MAG TPA: HAMP domain-containing sensor histidine kinase [Actinoplanes sp.]|nr:HAMP domain-containing sensor histidine kinase [Actinoplanes sp.]